MRLKITSIRTDVSKNARKTRRNYKSLFGIKKEILKPNSINQVQESVIYVWWRVPYYALKT